MPTRPNPRYLDLGLGDDWLSSADPIAPVIAALDDAISRRDQAKLSGLAFLAGDMAANGAPGIAKPLLQALLLASSKGRGHDLRNFGMETLELLQAVAADRRPRSILGADVQLAASQLAKSAGAEEVRTRLISLALRTYDLLRDATGAAIAHHVMGDALSEAGHKLDAVAQYRMAASRYRRLGDSVGQVEVLVNAISDALQVGDRQGALDDSNRLAHLDPGDAHLRASALRSRARALIATGSEIEARPLLIRALRSCRRRSDHELEVVVLQDLSILTESLRGARPAANWWRAALDACIKYDLRERQLEITRGLALNLHMRGEVDSAIELLEAAIFASESERDANFFLAESDLAAMKLQGALGTWRQGDEVDLGLLEESAARLAGVVSFSTTSRDVEEGRRAVHNLVIGSRLASEPCATLQTWLERLPPIDLLHEDVAEELAIAGVQCGHQWATDLLRTASRTSDRERQAMRLAAAAKEAVEDWGDGEGALRLMGFAIELLHGDENRSTRGDLLNDLSLILEDLRRRAEAEQALVAALQIAVESENRVLESMVRYNLGELKLREGDLDAPTFFERSAQLAAEVGDIDQAVESTIGAARWFIDHEDYEAARMSVQKARSLIAGLESSPRLGSVLSVEASLEYAAGRLGAAHLMWRQAADVSNDPEDAGFALDALARLGRRKQFERELERDVKRWTDPTSRIVLSQTLLASVWSWRKRDLHACAQTLASAQIISANVLVDAPHLMNPGSTYVRALAVASACTQMHDHLVVQEGDSFAEYFEEGIRTITRDELSPPVVLALMDSIRTLYDE